MGGQQRLHHMRPLNHLLPSTKYYTICESLFKATQSIKLVHLNVKQYLVFGDCICMPKRITYIKSTALHLSI